MAAPDSTLYLYTSLTAGSSHIITATSRLETILKANKIPFRAIDIATDDAARRLWGRYSKGRKLPGLVKFKTIVGDLEQIEEWNEYGELKDQIGSVADPDDFSSGPKTAAVEPPKPSVPAAKVDTTTSTSKNTSGTSTPHIQIQNPPVSEAKEDQRTLALRLASEEAAAKAKENARSKLGTKPVTTEANGKAPPTSDLEAKGTDAVVLRNPRSAPDDATDNTKSTTTRSSANDEKKPHQTPTASPAGRRSSVAPEIIAPLKRPSLADEVAAVSSANFHADNAELLGLVNHHRGSAVSATTQDEQDKVRQDIRASITEAPADGDLDAIRRTAAEKEDETIFEDEEEEEKEEAKDKEQAKEKEEVQVKAQTEEKTTTAAVSEPDTQEQDPKDESKAGVSVQD